MDNLDELLARNKISKDDFNRVSYECLMLSIFVQLCNYLAESENKKHLRAKLCAGTKMGEPHVFSNFIREHMVLDLDQEETEYVARLLNAYLNKSSERRTSAEGRRDDLLSAQEYRCRYCTTLMKDGKRAHVDHIVPFHYVGDELGDNNLQILCESCNTSKKASVIFLFKIFAEKGIWVD